MKALYTFLIIAIFVQSSLGIVRSSISASHTHFMMPEVHDSFASRVEWISISDHGFFNTAIRHTSNVGGRVVFSMGYQLSSVLGKYNSGIGIYSTGKLILRYGSASVDLGGYIGDFEILFSNGMYSINGESGFFNVQSFSSSDFICIGQTQDNSVITAKDTTKIFLVELWDESSHILAVPVRLEDGSGALYDQMSGKLLLKSEIGTFTAGPDVED